MNSRSRREQWQRECLHLMGFLVVVMTGAACGARASYETVSQEPQHNTATGSHSSAVSPSVELVTESTNEASAQSADPAYLEPTAAPPLPAQAAQEMEDAQETQRATHDDVTCEALPLLGAADGQDTGIDECAAHYRVRDISRGCPGGGAGERDYSTENAICDTDSDCHPGARCLGTTSRACRFPGSCTTNSHCDAGEACFCAVELLSGDERASPHDQNECLPADCVTESDCGEYTCDVAHSHCIGFTGAFCHGPEDECQNDEDCVDDAYCDYSLSDLRWYCHPWHWCK